MASFASFQTKLFALVFGVALLIVGAMTATFVAAAGASRGLTLERKSASYALLLGRELEPALAFDDLQTAREDIEAVATDPDVTAIALYDSSSRVVFSYGVFASPPPGPRALTGADGVTRKSATVAPREGARGSVVVELSMARVARERGKELRNAILVGALALGAGLVAAWLIARSVGRRVRDIAAATRAVAAGDLSQAGLDDRSPDELGQLSRSFGAMVDEIRTLLDRLKSQAAEEQSRLNHLVAERTGELDRKQRALQLVLDTVGDGIVLLDKSGRITEARAAIFDTWFGEVEGQPSFDAFIAAIDPKFAGWFSVGFDEVISGEMPLEITVAQLPASIESGDRRFAVRYRPVVVDDKAELLVLSITDVTAEMERVRQGAEQKELLFVFQRAMTDRNGVFDFLDEVSALVATLAATPKADAPALLRAAHTIKGNAAIFGVESVAAACHAFESAMIEGEPDEIDPAREAVVEKWRAAEKRLRDLLGEHAHRIEVAPAELDRVRGAVREGRSRVEILALVDALELEPATRRLERFVEPARALATRLGKPGLEVRISGDARVDGEALRGIWTALAHVVRNAVDHGIESPDDRVAAGKSPAGRLSLRAVEERDRIAILVEDDGRGIAWGRVGEQAKIAGRPADSRADLEAALFADGISTREVADEISGRGVGLAALRAAVVAMGGTVDVDSEPGRGTAFTLRLPKHRARTAGREALTSPASGPFC